MDDSCVSPAVWTSPIRHLCIRFFWKKICCSRPEFFFLFFGCGGGPPSTTRHGASSMIIYILKTTDRSRAAYVTCRAPRHAMPWHGIASANCQAKATHASVSPSGGLASAAVSATYHHRCRQCAVCVPHASAPTHQSTTTTRSSHSERARAMAESIHKYPPSSFPVPTPLSFPLRFRRRPGQRNRSCHPHQSLPPGLTRPPAG